MEIYVENHPEAAQGLIKYMEVVREIARKKGNWWYYDHEFRSTKFLVQIGWQMTHQELYVGALLDQSLHDLQQGANSDMGQKVNSGIHQPIVPVGYCAKFHLGNYCPLSCKYNHNCYKCNKLHASVCFTMVSGGSNSLSPRIIGPNGVSGFSRPVVENNCLGPRLVHQNPRHVKHVRPRVTYTNQLHNFYCLS